jgi:myosin-crossreactive antigen
MKRIIATLVAVVCLAGVSIAQQSDYSTMLDWLIQYKQDKAAAYEVVEQMRTKIQLEFPMDPKVQEAVTAAQQKRAAAEQAVAIRLGFANYQALYGDIKYNAAKYEGSAVSKELNQIAQEQITTQQNLTNAYNTEFRTRFEAACVEAIKRIQENANAMK